MVHSFLAYVKNYFRHMIEIRPAIRRGQQKLKPQQRMRGDGNDTAAHQHHIEQVETIVGIALHGIIDDTRQGDDGACIFMIAYLCQKSNT